ncbi:hypothetical protein [Natrinema caseinilyticum]|uniref:hypothetical protein n=1 Tax=Natrinema caseinilyticum TaxID=2961570 RepID=UPI0020C2B93D|nr:hypothetical protein [Natrinema caseinilyticum]
MPSTDDPRPSLPEWITDAYTVLSDRIRDSDRGESVDRVPAIRREHAVDVLRTTDELELDPGDADYAITRLLERGYFYEVDGELRITLPAEDP